MQGMVLQHKEICVKRQDKHAKVTLFFLVSCFGVSPDINDRGRGRVAGGSVQATRFTNKRL